jgi:hypothetical protein
VELTESAYSVYIYTIESAACAPMSARFASSAAPKDFTKVRGVVAGPRHEGRNCLR